MLVIVFCRLFTLFVKFQIAVACKEVKEDFQRLELFRNVEIKIDTARGKTESFKYSAIQAASPNLNMGFCHVTM